MESATTHNKEKALKPYVRRLKDKLDNLSLTVVAPTKVYSVYNQRIKRHLQCLRSLRIENPAIHDEVIQSNPEYKQLSEQFTDWANPQKRSQVRLTPEKKLQELQEYLNNPSNKDFFTEEKCSIKGMPSPQTSAPDLFRDRRRKLPPASSPVAPEKIITESKAFPNNASNEDFFIKGNSSTEKIRTLPTSSTHLFSDAANKKCKLPPASSPVPEEENPQTNDFAHKKFRRDLHLLKKIKPNTDPLRAPPLSTSARIFECNP